MTNTLPSLADSWFSDDAAVPPPRAVIEAHLEAVASRSVARGIVRVALAHARAVDVPTGGGALADFVRGPLFRRVADVLGTETARALLVELSGWAALRTAHGVAAEDRLSTSSTFVSDDPLAEEPTTPWSRRPKRLLDVDFLDEPFQYASRVSAS